MQVQNTVTNHSQKAVSKTLRLAVIMTCHNRLAKTLGCLEALYKQELSSNLEIQVYLVDDGSTDGTGEVVRSNYPAVNVLLGSGELFWNGGMRLAFAEAIKYDYDYYLWLNDDTILYPEAINNLLTSSHTLTKQGYVKTVVVGSTQDAKTGLLSYGGMIASSWWHPLKFNLIKPDNNQVKPCSTINGNCVLLSREVVQAVGNLDPAFRHSTGDFDYGLRVHKQGGSVWLAPRYVGTCEYNPLRHQAWDEPNLTLRQRWEKINQPRGLPIREWKVFARRHAGSFWIFYWLLPYARLVLKSVLSQKLVA
ncbi:MAG: glycosyltransferase family 2 protein [Pelatocladus maniniholoensis HA4357-MV3]|jgi:GT2 family glycosyltransferase|uniref:Glycosyltransferase family 2 protein n=1 Tax=Pelatocladus maniniholoensis HA4357-MV3 TaxID=1117104 RepID=A0A9E3H9S7_9NOST|nr:glycosyltransferase family 2 protein [Pelatocladus maniniholoensis HA4357-MV3]BAZ69115.1 family 2 glycosyl transferase [Fischerella sp. NIES-4106]